MAWTLKRFSSALRARGAYRRIFRTEDGQRVLADMAERYCVTRPISSEGMSDRQAWKNEGKREVVIDIMNTLNLDPDTLPKEYDNG
ncbi:hypothetical protein PSDVSF_05780 [Pseudodesulfovibrio sediminis]|uniref:Bbp19-like phage domain-containing protein n=2 Tax=Pseudodesulfovibrio sediminis TaxID=2810563 RepID=A0ABM7P3J8_9BACT|nr:hypothetical protein PSDVSF_05780 [Pseudodesulfovibrio sediminis]